MFVRNVSLYLKPNTITEFVQASAVGSNLSRWMTFAIFAGTIVTYFVVSNLVGLPLENI